MISIRTRFMACADNATQHLDERAQQAIRDTGALLVFLPPYSPEWNPVRLFYCFCASKVLFAACDSLDFPSLPFPCVFRTDQRLQIELFFNYIKHTWMPQNVKDYSGPEAASQCVLDGCKSVDSKRARGFFRKSGFKIPDPVDEADVAAVVAATILMDES